MCNLNMGETLEKSVKSIHSQISDEFEILIVDGGSSDNSYTVLDKLEKECDRVRSIRLDEDPQRRLGEERNIGVREASGEFVLLQMDADDYYNNGILDFVEVYHQLEERLESEFYLKGDSINMAPRDLLLQYGPYRNIHAGEDEDLWRRLFADNAIIWLEHDRFFYEIKDYKNTFSRKLERAIDKKAGELQSGVSFASCLHWVITSDRSTLKQFLLYILAYFVYLPREKYELPDPYHNKNMIHIAIEKDSTTLSELELSLEEPFNRESLSDNGQRLFFNEKNDNV